MVLTAEETADLIYQDGQFIESGRSHCEQYTAKERAELVEAYARQYCKEQKELENESKEGAIPYVILKIEKGVGVHAILKCTNCSDVKGVYLGMTCPLCHRAFRDVKKTNK